MMNPDILEERIGVDHAIKMAHVKLHNVKGKVSVYPVIEEYYESADEDSEADEPDGGESDAEQGDAESRTTKGKGEAKVKYKFGKAEPSEFRNNYTHAMAAYFVPASVKGLITAKEIASMDMNIAPLVMTAEEREEYTEDQPFTAPIGKLLEFKPDLKSIVSTLPKSKRSRQRMKKREARQDAVVHDLLKLEHPHLKTLADDLQQAEQEARGRGIPVWEQVLDTPKLVGGRPRSKSVPTYRDKTTQELDRDAVTANFRKIADEHVALSRLQLGANMRPTGDQIMAQLHHFISKRPHCRDENGHLQADKIHLFLEWMRYTHHWMTTVKAIEQVMYREFFGVTTGILPVEAAHCQMEAADIAHWQSLTALPTKGREQKKKKGDMTPAEVMADRLARLEAKANARNRVAPLERNVCKISEEPEEFEQNQDNHVLLQMVEQAENRSFARLRHTINYLDATVPNEQPSHKAYVDLTHANTCGPLSQGQRDIEYVPTHRVVDVTDPKWYPSLAKIFRQTESVEDYWKGMHAGLVMSDYKLFLITIKHNTKHCTSNLFAHQQDVPDLVKDLRIVTRSSPIIFMLVRSHNIDELMEGLIKRFHDLTRNDPALEFYKSIDNPSLSNTGVRETSQLPKFTALPQMHFSTWEELQHEAGIGALIEQRFQMGNQEYNAKAAAVPVPGSYHRDANLYMAYLLQVSMRHDANKPRLMPGDHVTVDMNPDADTQAINEDVWRGRVTEPTKATAMGMINVIVERPSKNGIITDKMEYSDLPMTRMKQMNAEDLLTWTQRNCKMNIVMYTENDDKECKRLMGNLARMTLSEDQRVNYAEKARRLDAARLMLTCTDHAKAKATALYNDIEAQHRQVAINFVTAMLRPHQRKEYMRWVENGVYNRTIWLTGPSGSGKTYLAMATMLPYLGNVEVPEELINISSHEQELHFQKQTVTKAKKKAKKEKEDATKQSADATQPGANKKQPAADATSAGKDKTEKKQQDPKIQEAIDRYKEARDNMAPPKASRKTVTERGRITIAAMQNEAVDSQYVLMSAMAKTYCQKMGQPTPLVLRLHSKEAELKAVAAMAHPNYNPGVDVSRAAIDPSVKITDDLLNSLLSDYLSAFRGGQAGIADRRFKHIEGSAARYILELAQFPTFDASQELLDAFSDQELEAWAKELKPLLDAYSELSNNNGKSNKEIKNKIATAAKTGLNVLLERADVICTTVSVATQASFNMTRRAHVIALEEAGRANDAETVGLFSHYWHASLRLISGAVNQLRPAAFGDEKQNPFSKLLTVSTIARIQATGGAVSQLEASSRFHNEALFRLCAHVNAMPNMTLVQNAFNTELSEKYAEINKKIWGIKTNLIFLNTKGIATQRDANRSTYCRETAAVAIQDAINRMAYMDGKDHVIITPYNAQVMMLRRQRDHAVMMAHTTRKNELANKLLDIEIVTIDSFMGKDRASVTVDTVGAVGHLFEFGRTVVATTRARTSCQLVGPTTEYTAPNSNVKQSHPLTQAIRHMNKQKWIRLLELTEIRGMEPYQTAMKAAGLGEEGEAQAYAKASTIADVLYKEADHDAVDLDIVARMREIKPDLKVFTESSIVTQETKQANATWGNGQADTWGNEQSDATSQGDEQDDDDATAWDNDDDTAAWGNDNATAWDNQQAGTEFADETAPSPKIAPSPETFFPLDDQSDRVFPRDMNESPLPWPDSVGFPEAPNNEWPGNDELDAKAFTKTLEVDDEDMPEDADMYAEWPRDTPYQTCKREGLLTMRIVEAFDAYSSGTEQPAEVSSEAWEALDGQERFALNRLAQCGNVGTLVAAEVLKARGNYLAALEHLLVMCAARADPGEGEGLTWEEYRTQTEMQYNELRDEYENTFTYTRNPYGTCGTAGDLDTAYQMIGEDSCENNDTVVAAANQSKPGKDFYEQDGSEPEEKEESDDGPCYDYDA